MRIADGWTLIRVGVILGIIGLAYLAGYNSGFNRGYEVGEQSKMCGLRG
jgi:hypothetical protein